MNPKYVTSLELSKKLYDLEVRIGSLFRWVVASSWSKSRDGGKTPGEGKWFIERGDGSCFASNKVFPAYTVAELGDILWDVFEKIGWSFIYKVYGEVFGFKGTSYIGELGIVNLMRIPDMSAKMLIYLLENKLITVEQIKKK
jgi:hypothetical protein